MATAVSKSKISPNRVKRWICVHKRGIMAKIVVTAELKMDTPMKDMAAMTLLTRREAPSVICTNR